MFRDNTEYYEPLNELCLKNPQDANLNCCSIILGTNKHIQT